MKIAHVLLRIGGAANALFFFFHLWLGWRVQTLVQIDPGLRSLLEMLNGGGALFILFLAVASLAFSREVLTTNLGRAVLILGTALYLLRAAAEVVVSPHRSQAILATCLVTGVLYLLSLLLSCRGRSRQ
jgi:hypothetical protein